MAKLSKLKPEVMVKLIVEDGSGVIPILIYPGFSLGIPPLCCIYDSRVSSHWICDCGYVLLAYNSNTGCLIVMFMFLFLLASGDLGEFSWSTG